MKVKVDRPELKPCNSENLQCTETESVEQEPPKITPCRKFRKIIVTRLSCGPSSTHLNQCLSQLCSDEPAVESHVEQLVLGVQH